MGKCIPWTHSLSSETIPFSVKCEKTAGDGSVLYCIICEVCCAWYHFTCVGTDAFKVDSVPSDVEFICFMCNDEK